MILPAETDSFAPPSCPVWRCSLVMGCLVRVMALPELDPVVPVIIVTVGCLQNSALPPSYFMVIPSSQHCVFSGSFPGPPPCLPAGK